MTNNEFEVRSSDDATCQGASRKWSLVVAVNDERVLNSTLLKSPAIDSQCQLIVKRNFRSAAQAYNEAIDEATSEILIFSHSDVYLPQQWLTKLHSAVTLLTTAEPRWGVLGVVGVAAEGGIRGHIYSTGLGRTIGHSFAVPLRASSLDEVVLVMRRSSGLRFDQQLPGFHFYGTDICMEAARCGMNSYIVPAFCIHNSNGVGYLPAAFWRSYFYMRRKWWGELPITTCCTTITKAGVPMLRHIVSTLRNHLFGESLVGRRSSNPELLYTRLTTPSEFTASCVSAPHRD